MKRSSALCVSCTAFLCSWSTVWGDLDSFVYPGGSLSGADWHFVGEFPNDRAGSQSAVVGDVDGDGYEEVLVIAPRYMGFNDYSNTGRFYLVSGVNLARSAGSVSLSMADYTVWGARHHEADLSFGAVARAGDVDGDGLSDFMVADEYNDDGSINDRGVIYLFLGGTFSSYAPGDYDASIADYQFYGENVDDRAGCQVALAGDVDGDGLDDILIGAQGNDDGGSDAGKVYLVLGRSIVASTSRSIYLGSADCVFVGENDFDYAGQCISSAGDVDGDGLDDILIGAQGNDDGGSDAGKVYLVLAASVAGSGSREINLAQADYTWIGEATNDGCYTVAAGEVDGDGYSDVLIGVTRNDDRAVDAGKVCLFRGVSIISSTTDAINLSDADHVFLGENPDDFLGSAVTVIDDVDADGLSDILLGASGYNTYAGKSYLFLGASLLGTNYIFYSGVDEDYAFEGEGANESSRFSLDASGDVDGDGLSDLVFGSFGNSDSGSLAGKAYLIFSMDCRPDEAVYVDGLYGQNGASGGPDCPVQTIQEGINLAASLSITQVIVRGWFYQEAIVMAPDVQVLGELRYFGSNAVPPYIINPSTNSTGYTVYGADRAALRYCVVVANYSSGGIELNGVNEMSVRENVVFVSEDTSLSHWNRSAAIYLHDGASLNRFENNMIFSMAESPHAPAVWLGRNSSDNEFINNTMHRMTYTYFTTKYTIPVVRLEQYTQRNEFRNNILHSTAVTSVLATVAAACTNWYGFSADTTANTTYTIEYNKTGVNNRNVTLGAGCLANAQTPLFEAPKPSGFNYRIRTFSTCRNAGDPDAVYNDIDGSRNDMGVYGGPNSIDFLP